MSEGSLAVVKGRGFGFFILGASLHDILSRLYAEPQTYPKIGLRYSTVQPIAAPVAIELPNNGIRLRFDGVDQRLRLIEVVDFSKTALSYNERDIVRLSEIKPGPDGQLQNAQPKFKHLYNQFGLAHPGEYLPPSQGDQTGMGTYVLSYEGVAFRFPLRDTAWSPDADFVALMSSTAAAPATCMVIFNGRSWPEARGSIFTSEPPNPRSLALTFRPKESVPDEVELAKVHGEGRIELVRRSSPSFWILLSETTPQDLITELGPPDAIHWKHDKRMFMQRGRDMSESSSTCRADSTDTDLSSAHDASESSGEENDDEQTHEPANADHFYCYYSHGFDVFISYPREISPPSPTAPRVKSPSEPDCSSSDSEPPALGRHLVATKVFLHGNIPGSYPFNRHRRSRWTLNHVPSGSYTDPLTSEMGFTDISGRLKEVWRGYYPNEVEEDRQQKAKVLNRAWSNSPSSSVELLGGWEDAINDRGRRKDDGGHGPGNTSLYGFPGTLFEVLKNDHVSCLMVY